MGTPDQIAKIASRIVSKWEIRGSSDEGYIANVIRHQVERFAAIADAQVVERAWSGRDATTGLTRDELLKLAEAGSSNKVAQAAAIAIARAYSTAVARKWPLEKSIEMLAREIDAGLGTSSAPAPALSASADLAFINAHRRALWMPPLDPVASGWGEEDLRAEVERIKRLTNPDPLVAALKADLLSY